LSEPVLAILKMTGDVIGQKLTGEVEFGMKTKIYNQTMVEVQTEVGSKPKRSGLWFAQGA